MVTDYDCWRSESEDIDVTEILATMAKNVELAKRIISKAVPRLAKSAPSELASEALKFALITNRDNIPEETLRNLHPIVGRYLS
jgi:5'-methylthioadenosine phosphorylase